MFRLVKVFVEGFVIWFKGFKGLLMCLFKIMFMFCLSDFFLFTE